MKFAFCLFKYFPYGGLQRGFMELARICIKRGHQVDVYAGSWEGREAYLGTSMKVYTMPVKSLTNHRRCQLFARRLNQILKTKYYDAVVGFNKMPGLDIYFASDICYAAKAQERNLLYRFSGRCRTFMEMERAVFDEASKTQIISISELTRQQYINHYNTPEERFHNVPPGISEKLVAEVDTPGLRSSLRREFSIQPNENIILMVGSNFRTKGVDRAIRAFESLPRGLRAESFLVVVGKGKVKPYLRLAKRLNIADRVIFTGERDDVAGFLAGSDLLLHPARYENTGNVLIEAMAAGLPVLVTDNCGYADYVRRAGAGKLIPSPFTQEQLNKILRSMLTADNRSEWRLNGKRYVEKIDIYGRHEKAADVIEKIAAERSAQRIKNADLSKNINVTSNINRNSLITKIIPGKSAFSMN